MKIEQLPSGSYRVRKQVNKMPIALIFDHKPTNAEIIQALAEKSKEAPKKGSFRYCAESYMRSKSNVVSPSTIKGYTSILNALPEDFTKLDVSKITQIDIQTVVNDYAADHAPKSVRNVHGFISAVLWQFSPDMVIHTTLPQKAANEHYIPSEEDIRKILDACKDNPFYHIPFRLGIMGLRKSEILALTMDDIDFENNILTINKALVKDSKNKWILKQTKTAAGTREIYIPEDLAEEIRQFGRIFDGDPTTLLYGLNRYQDKLGIPRFRFHDLRHFFASYAHSKGISDADIMATGGWKSDFTMKSIYRHEMKAKEAQKKIFDSFS